MHAALLFLWSLVAIAPAHAGGEVPTEPLVLAHVQPAPPPSSVTPVAPAAPPNAAMWLERARRRHQTAKTGGLLIAVGLPVSAVGVGILFGTGYGFGIGTGYSPEVSLGVITAGTTLFIGGSVTALVGVGMYTIASTMSARALTLAGHYTNAAAGIAGIVCFGLSFIPTPLTGLTSIAAIVLGAVQTTINGSQLRAVDWSMAPAMLGDRGTPGLAFSMRF